MKYPTYTLVCPIGDVGTSHFRDSGILMNDEIEYFKRFAKSYMRWTHFNFDRIVADVVRNDREAEEARKEELLTRPYREQMSKLFASSDRLFNKMAKDVMRQGLLSGRSQWITEFNKDAKVGDVLKIRLPKEYQKPDNSPCN